MSKTRIALLGSTGSIGRQTIEVVRSAPERFEIVALVAGRDEKGLRRQAEMLGVPRTGLGSDAAVSCAALDEVEVVVNAVVGAAGLRASVAALQAGKRLALANKESLVAGGEVCLAAARLGGASIVPIDSEHAALSQALRGCDRSTVRGVVLTASGGPFRERPDLEGVTPDEALAHPTWDMGARITIDSATLMNKGLEVIEAHHLFGFPYERISAVVHPQSVVHGIVELNDGSMLMQAAPTDMRIPIAAALAGPGDVEVPSERLRVQELGSLTFEGVDRERFPSLDLAYRAGRTGGTAPAVLNAADEIAVAAFLAGDLAFTRIPAVVEATLDRHEVSDASSLDAVLEADRWARSVAGAIARTSIAGATT